jgi:hypothetical protein
MIEQKITTYRLTHLPGAKFVRRPVSIPPKDGALCFIDRGTADVANWPTGAWYRDGRWLDMRDQPLKMPPTFWTEVIKDD